MDAIRVDKITKSFGNLQVLKGIDLVVQPGEIFTLLGENGAGKSTLVNILTTLSQPDHGTVKIFNLDIGTHGDQIRKMISLNAQSNTLDEQFTGYQNLSFIAKLRGVDNPQTEIENLANGLNLTDFIQRKVSTYSGGMKRRLDIAMSLVGAPQLLFLDEPTTGVDPKNRLELWKIITDLKKSGKTIFLTTQYLDEAERLSDHIAFIHGGRIVRYGTPQTIKKSYMGTYSITVKPEQVDLVQELLADEKIAFKQTAESFSVKKENAALAVSILLENNILVQHFNIDENNLEDVFLNIANEKGDQ